MAKDPWHLSVDKLPGPGGQSKKLKMEIPANSEVAALQLKTAPSAGNGQYEM
jgi:hypothetical protein